MDVIDKNRINKQEINRIIVRATNWVGDMVMSLPALEAIRDNFPQSQITVLAKPWVEDMLRSHPAVDRIITLNKGQGFISDIFEILSVVQEIRRSKFDLAVLFQNAFEAALLAFLGGVRYRVGYNTDARGILLTHPVKRDPEIMKRHQVEYYLAILSSMHWPAEKREPRLFIAENDQQKAETLLKQGGMGDKQILLGLCPGAIYGPAKRWPAERFAAIGDRAAKTWQAGVILFGSAKEREICQQVAQNMEQPLLDLGGSTKLGEAVAVMQKCHFILTNDSGLMHVAAALGRPLAAIFGSTNPVTTGPASKKAVVIRSETDCAPCLKPVCPKDFRCMLDISTDEVWDKMQKLKEKYA